MWAIHEIEVEMTCCCREHNLENFFAEFEKNRRARNGEAKIALLIFTKPTASIWFFYLIWLIPNEPALASMLQRHPYSRKGQATKLIHMEVYDKKCDAKAHGRSRTGLRNGIRV